MLASSSLLKYPNFFYSSTSLSQYPRFLVFVLLLKILAVDEREVSISRELHHLTNFTNWNFSFNFSGLSPIIRFLSHCLLFFTFLVSFFPDYKRLPILREHLLWCDEPYFSVFKPISLPANVPAAPKPIKFT